MDAPGDDDFAPVQARLEQAIAAGEQSVREARDDETAYRRASWLAERLRQATISAGEMRLCAVVRIQDAGKLSLAKLGDRIGVSKARAAEMMKVAAKRKDPPR